MLFLAPQLGDSAKAKAQDLHLQHVHAQQAGGRGGGEGVLVGAASGGKTAGRGERPWLAALRSSLLPRPFHPSILLFLATFLKGRRRKKNGKKLFWAPVCLSPWRRPRSQMLFTRLSPAPPIHSSLPLSRTHSLSLTLTHAHTLMFAFGNKELKPLAGCIP